MPPKDQLAAALKSVDWNANVEIFLSSDDLAERLASCNFRIALWSKQLEQVDHDNPALSFIREMQSSGQQVAAMSALATYKAAAASIRAVIETALYYTYFRSHPEELATLKRVKSYYVGKSDVIEYHRTHTPRFKELQQTLGLSQRLEDTYSLLSAIVHGQLPGSWTSTLKATAFNSDLASVVVGQFEEATEVVHRLFFCTVGLHFWDDFSTPSKRALLKGMAGDLKALLGVDAA